MVDLSVIIVSYNTSQITAQCIESLLRSLASHTVSHEIIVVDNASTDDSVNTLKKFPQVKVIENKENVGFGKANNQGVAVAQGKYILYLNSDVIIDEVHFSELVQYLNEHKDIGVLTVKVNLKNNGIDPASHRGFPTLWRSFCYFSGLELALARFKIFGGMFGGYHLLDKDFSTVHEIDSPTGAFYLTRKEIVDKLGGFDEQFFMYGEDLDLSYRIKEAGYKVIYYPLYTVTHLKSSSGLKKDQTEVRKKTRNYFYQAMRIFYDKHYARRYPAAVNYLVHQVIGMKMK